MSQTEAEIVEGIGSDHAIKYGFSVAEDYFFKSGCGLDHELVDAISSHKPLEYAVEMNRLIQLQTEGSVG